MKTALVCMAAFSILSSAYASDSVTLVGLDENGEPIEIALGKEEYVKRLEAVSSAVTDSAIPALAEAYDARESKLPKWMLRTVAVGVGVGLEAGIGPILKVKAVPRFKLVFANSSEPILP